MLQTYRQVPPKLKGRELFQMYRELVKQAMDAPGSFNFDHANQRQMLPNQWALMGTSRTPG